MSSLMLSSEIWNGGVAALERIVTLSTITSKWPSSLFLFTWLSSRRTTSPIASMTNSVLRVSAVRSASFDTSGLNTI